MARTRECTECREGWETLNGKYCPVAGQMVEYAPEPPCRTKNEYSN